MRVGRYVRKVVILQNDPFTKKVMGDLDPELLDLIQSKVNTFLKWDLVKFFGENPGTVDSAAQIAIYIGREAQAVEAELDNLALEKILRRADSPAARLYALASDAPTRALIQKFLRACNDRDFRVKAVYHMMRGMHAQ